MNCDSENDSKNKTRVDQATTAEPPPDLTDSQLEARTALLELFESHGFPPEDVLAMSDEVFSELLEDLLAEESAPLPDPSPPADISPRVPPPPIGGPAGVVMGSMSAEELWRYGGWPPPPGAIVIPQGWMSPVVARPLVRDPESLDRERQDAEFAALEKSASEGFIREARAKEMKPPPRVPTAEMFGQLGPAPECGVTVAARVGARRTQRVFDPEARGEDVYVWVAFEGQMSRDGFTLGISGSAKELLRERTLAEQGVTGRVLVNVMLL